MSFDATEMMDRGDGVKLAFERVSGIGPTMVWLSGFKSDMGGTKAEALARWARDCGRNFLRLDYSGHGRSQGAFEDGTIGRWRDDALAVIDAQSAGPLVLVGSSMGGWMALLVALARPERVQSLLLLAPAPDFTETLMWARFSDTIRAEIMETGRWLRPSAYDPEPYPITRRLIEEGRRHLLMDKPIPFHGRVRILQGMQDPDVPWQHALKLVAALESADVEIDLLKDGDHRLSRPQDLARLLAAAEQMSVSPAVSPDAP